MSDEAIITSQALLGQFDVTGAQVQELIPLIVDLSAKLGIDMEAATKSVGKAVIGNTAGLHRYGIVIEEIEGKGSEFNAVLQGLQGTVGGFAEQRGQEEPWRILAAQFDELAEEVGHVLIPIMKEITAVLLKLGPVLNFVGDHAQEILFSPRRLRRDQVAAGSARLDRRGIPGSRPRAGRASRSAAGSSVTSGPSSVRFRRSRSTHRWRRRGSSSSGNRCIRRRTSPRRSSRRTSRWQHCLSRRRQTSRSSRCTSMTRDASAESFQGNVDRINESLAKSGIQYTLTTGALEGLVDGQTVAGLGAGALEAAQESLNAALDEGGKKAHRFGFQSKSAFQDFKQGVEDSVEVGIGEFEKLGDAFDTTPKELQKQLNLAIQIARREQRVLREIFADDSLTKAQKTALAELPANMRDAWSEAGKAGKKQIRRTRSTLKNLNARNFREVTKPRRRSGEGGSGRAVGKTSDGRSTSNGIRRVRVRHRCARERLYVRPSPRRTRKPGLQSPSKRMAELGVDMMVGLANGIQDAEQKAIDAAKRAMEKTIEEVSSALDKVKGKASSFADTIRGGFSGFARHRWWVPGPTRHR